MKEIDGSQTVYQLVQEHPELKEVLVNLGFTPLKNDRMLNTLGRMMSLNDGIKQIGITREQLEKALAAANYQIKKLQLIGQLAL